MLNKPIPTSKEVDEYFDTLDIKLCLHTFIRDNEPAEEKYSKIFRLQLQSIIDSYESRISILTGLIQSQQGNVREIKL